MIPCESFNSSCISVGCGHRSDLYFISENRCNVSKESSEDPSGLTEAASLREQLDKESGSISWAELVRHFARGVVIRVDREVDLIEVAECFANDDTDRLQTWLTDKTVARASDDDARYWTEAEPEFRCVVAAPWVLVQELGSAARADVGASDTMH